MVSGHYRLTSCANGMLEAAATVAAAAAVVVCDEDASCVSAATVSLDVAPVATTGSAALHSVTNNYMPCPKKRDHQLVLLTSSNLGRFFDILSPLESLLNFQLNPSDSCFLMEYSVVCDKCEFLLPTIVWQSFQW